MLMHEMLCPMQEVSLRRDSHADLLHICACINQQRASDAVPHAQSEPVLSHASLIRDALMHARARPHAGSESSIVYPAARARYVAICARPCVAICARPCVAHRLRACREQDHF